MVDGKCYEFDEIAHLNPKSIIRLGAAKFYFIPSQAPKQAVKKTPTKAYSDMLDCAYDTLTVGSDNGVTQRDVIDWIMINYPAFSDESKRNNLAQGIYMAFNKKYERIPPQPHERPKVLRWKRKVKEIPEDILSLGTS